MMRQDHANLYLQVGSERGIARLRQRPGGGEITGSISSLACDRRGRTRQGPSARPSAQGDRNSHRSPGFSTLAPEADSPRGACRNGLNSEWPRRATLDPAPHQVEALPLRLLAAAIHPPAVTRTADSEPP